MLRNYSNYSETLLRYSSEELCDIYLCYFYQYKEFFKFAKDSRDIRNLKYLPKIANTKQDSEDRVVKVAINQKMLWVPRDAFSLALHLK
jgi:hypothetical protein